MRNSWEKSRDWWRQTWPKLREDWDTNVAIALGVAIGGLGIVHLASLETTVGTTLLVLAVVAGSLRRDRDTRKDLVDRLDLLSRAFSSPLPYEVISGRYEWDFEPGGKIANVRKRAEVRFVQNGVWTILQWHTQGIDVRDPRARRLLKERTQELEILAGPTNSPQNRIGKYIALNREWLHSEILSFEYRFQSHGNFPSGEEWVEVDIETTTGELALELLWADDRVPERVRLIGKGEPTPLSVDRREGRWRTTIELQNLARDAKVEVRWEWKSLDELQATSRDGGDDDG